MKDFITALMRKDYAHATKTGKKGSIFDKGMVALLNTPSKPSQRVFYKVGDTYKELPENKTLKTAKVSTTEVFVIRHGMSDNGPWVTATYYEGLELDFSSNLDEVSWE